MIDLAQVHDTEIVFQRVGGLIDQVLALMSGDAVGVVDLKPTWSFLKVDV